MGPSLASGRPVTPHSVLDAALVYAAAGLHVFPLSPSRVPIRLCSECKPGGACPGKQACRCGTDTCHGFYAATTDPGRITRWFSDHPEWQLGLRTGSVSGVVVLDVDLHDGGLDSSSPWSGRASVRLGAGCSSVAAASPSTSSTGTRAATCPAPWARTGAWLPAWTSAVTGATSSSRPACTPPPARPTGCSVHSMRRRCRCGHGQPVLLRCSTPSWHCRSGTTTAHRCAPSYTRQSSPSRRGCQRAVGTAARSGR